MGCVRACRGGPRRWSRRLLFAIGFVSGDRDIRCRLELELTEGADHDICPSTDVFNRCPAVFDGVRGGRSWNIFLRVHGNQ